MNKFWKITICVGLALSIVAIIFCICRIFPRTYNLGIDYIGIIVGILSLLVTILIGWNIYTVLDIKCTISCNKTANAPASPIALHKQIRREFGRFRYMSRFILRIGNGLPWSSALSRRNTRNPIRS